MKDDVHWLLLGRRTKKVNSMIGSRFQMGGRFDAQERWRFLCWEDCSADQGQFATSGLAWLEMD